MNPSNGARGGTARRGAFDNGLPYVAVELEGPRDAAVVFGVRAGSRHEEARLSGISHLLEHMVFRGSKAYPSARALNLALEDLGGTLDAVTSAESTEFELTLPHEHLREGVARFALALDTPTLAGLALEKRVIREEILEDLDERGRDIDVDDLARRAMFGDHPLGLTIPGTLESLDRITEDDLRRYHARHYVARNGVLVIVGRGAFDAVESARTGFGTFPAGERLHPRPAPSPPTAPRFAYTRDPGSQSDVRLSLPSVAEGHPDLVAMTLLMRLLDDGMASRLPTRLRDELGLVYDAFAGLESFEDAGVADLGGTVSHDAVPELVRELSAQLRTLATDRVADDELARTKRRYGYDLDRLGDDALSLASFHATRSLLGVEGDVDALAERAAGLTADDLLAVARRVFDPKVAHVAVVGDLGARAEERYGKLLAELAKAGR